MQVQFVSALSPRFSLFTYVCAAPRHLSVSLLEMQKNCNFSCYPRQVLGDLAFKCKAMYLCWHLSCACFSPSQLLSYSSTLLNVSRFSHSFLTILTCSTETINTLVDSPSSCVLFALSFICLLAVYLLCLSARVQLLQRFL